MLGAVANAREESQVDARRRYRTERVVFKSADVEIVGLLFLPLGNAGKKPAVVLLGPFGFVKEQAPAQYAARLADAGYVALAFDPRFSGESGGTPRRLESPTSKIADVKAALDYVIGLDQVDALSVGILGICQGSSEMIAVAAEDPRVRALVAVSGQYLYPENLDGFFGGGGPTRVERIERGRRAKAAHEAGEEVSYTPVVSPNDKSVGLPWKPIFDWYIPWTSDKWGAKSRWENRYATMSDAEVWSFDVDVHASKVQVPTLIVHGEQSDGGVEAAKHVFSRIAAREKDLSIIPGVFHTRFYDDPLVVEPAAAQVIDWFDRHLMVREDERGAKTALVGKFYQALRDHDKSLLGEVLAKDWVDVPAAPGQAPGLEGMKAAMDGYFQSFPDFSPSNDAFIVEGDFVVVRSTIRATQKGEFAGISPSGKSIEITAIDIHELRGGRIVRTWHVEDWLRGLFQMGALPPKG